MKNTILSVIFSLFPSSPLYAKAGTGQTLAPFPLSFFALRSLQRLFFARPVPFKDLFDDRIAQLGTAIFVDDPLVVHRARTSAPPLFADADVAVLPDIHTDAILKGEHRLELLPERLRLIFLAPLGRIGRTRHP